MASAAMGEGSEGAVNQLVEAGFDRHAAEVALASAGGNIDRAASLILSWDGATVPPPPVSQPIPRVPTIAGVASGDALRIRTGAAATAGGRMAPGEVPEALPPLPPAGPVVPSRHASEAEERQRVLNKQRAVDANQVKQQRAQAKRRREQELAIWREQRDDAKQRKATGVARTSSGRTDGGGLSGAPGEADATGTSGTKADEKSEAKPTDEAAVLVMRLPDGTTVTNSFRRTATLGEVAAWLHTNNPSGGKLGGRDIELRCPFPPPGRAVAGADLNEITVEGIGLAPRGRVMVQFSGGAGIKQGKGAMTPPGGTNTRGTTGPGGFRGPGGSRDPSRGRGRGRIGRGASPGGVLGGRGERRGGRGGGGSGGRGRGYVFGEDQGEELEDGHQNVWQAGEGEDYEEDEVEVGDTHGGEAESEAGSAADAVAGESGGGEGGHNEGVGDVEDGSGNVDDLDDDEGNDDDDANDYGDNGDDDYGGDDQDIGGEEGPIHLQGVGGAGGGGMGAGRGAPWPGMGRGVGVLPYHHPGGLPHHLGGPPPGHVFATGPGHVLGSSEGESSGPGGAPGGMAEEGESISDADRAALVRQQRLARLAGSFGGAGRGGSGGGGDGGGVGGGGDDEWVGRGGGGRKARLVSVGQKPASVGTLQDILVESISQKLKAGGHLGSYGQLDGKTGGRIMQRLADMKVITSNMVAAFQGCPVCSLSLDNNPRATNALLATLGCKVSLTSLSLARSDCVTVDGIESITKLKALRTLDVSGCRVTPRWMMAIAKLPALEKLVLRGCAKVADLGVWNLSRGARSLTSLDLTACVSVTDAGIAHLASAVAGAGAQQQDRLVQEAGGGLQELRLDGLPELSDVGIDSLCPAADGGPGRIATGARLRLLSVAGCRRISDAGVIRIGLSLSASLREFDISGTSATEAGLIQMTGASGSGGGGGEQRIGREIRLQKISLPMYGREISAAGLSAITGSMTELTSLNLEGCNSPGVTSQGLAEISRLKELRFLELANVRAFDDHALSVVCPSCSKLQTLNLNGTGVHLAQGLAFVGAGMTDLSLEHTNVDDDAMDAVASLRGLTTLTLRGTKVTGVGITRLSCLSNLRSLNLAGTSASREGDGGHPASAVEALRRSTAALNIRV